MNVFCLHFSAISFLLPWQWSSNKELIFGRQLKGWPPDPIAHCGCGRRWSSSTENRCGVPHNHPRPISEAQMCHQCVIEHTSLLEATEPSPPARPIRMRGRRVAFLPILWNGAENGKQGHAPHCLSVLNLRSWPAKLHWDALIYLSVNRKGGEERGGGGIGASNQSPLPSQMHNSVFLSQQPELRRAQLPQPCGQQSANMKEAQNPLCCSFRLSGCTHSQSYLYDLFSLFIHGLRLRPQWTSWETFFFFCPWQRKCVGFTAGCLSDTGVA